MRVGKRISAVFLLSVLVAGTLALIASRGAALSASTNESVNHTNEVLKKLDLVFEDLVDVETGSRGYALTGQPAFLEPYVVGSARALGDLADLRALIADNPKQVKLWGQLSDVARKRIDVARRTVVLRYTSGIADAAAFVATGQGKALTDTARGVVMSMRQEENRLLVQQLALAQRRAREAIVFIVSSMVALVLVMLLGVLWLTRSITYPMATLAQAARQFGQGGQPAALDMRRDEIGDFARVFMEMSRQRQQAEDRVRALIELAPDAFFQADLDARFTDVNVAACRLLGYEREELVGKTVFDIIPAEDAIRLVAVRDQLLAPGEVHRAEWTQRRKDGTLVPVEVSSNILPDGRWQAFVRDISERRRLEDERQVFVSLIANSSDFIGIADPDGKPIYVNPAGRRMVGLPADYPVEQTQIPDYYPPEERRFAIDVIYQSMVEQGRFSGETYFRHWQTGEAIPVSDEHFMIRDPRSGRVLGMGTITRDISEARRQVREREELLARERTAREQLEVTSAKLRVSEERFRLTIDEAPIGMALVALDGRFERVNLAFCDIVGYRGEELERLTFQDITHADDLQADVALAGQLARGEIPRYQLEKRYIRKDGGIVTVMLSASVLRQPGGSALSYIVQVEDITARKRTEQALRESEAKASGILSISADALISIDEDQRITMFNEGAEKIFGYSKAETLGAPLGMLLPERYRAVHREYVEQFAEGQEVARRMGLRSAAIVGMRKSGEEFPAGATISKLELSGRRILTVALRDVTEQRMLEDQLRRALQSRDEVLAVVAHDLRNPLAAIVMQASTLVRRTPDLERRNQHAAERIARAATQMDHLIQDLLDVAQVEAGALRVQGTPISVRDLIAEAVTAQLSFADSSELTLKIELQREELPDVWGDRHRLLRVFENLIGNAIKFTEAGGRVTVGADTSDGEVVFRISDTGCGISAESVPHVFDRFWQAAAHAGRLGAGLGLPITKGIVEAHGGRIWVESTLGRGSTFFFTIPIVGPNRSKTDATPSDAFQLR
jgi:PAS domain S-box-containing protein